VGTAQLVVTIVFIILLGGLGLFYGARQIQALRQLKADDQSPPEERRHFRNQAWRRLASALLLLCLAGLLAGWFFFEEQAQAVAEASKAARDRGETGGPDEADKPFIQFITGYWIVFLLVLLSVLGLAFWDLIALRRYGRRAFQKLQADRRAMIERQAARLREQRNGQASD
jgi:hypothetical protein